MKRKRFFLWVAVLIAVALTGLLLLWADVARVQASTAQPRVTAVVVTDTDKMIWDAIGINVGDDMYPDVAYNSQDDEYLVVFEWEDTGGGSGRDLASVRVDANGQASYSPQGVAISGLYTDTRPAVAYNPTNNTYLAVWERSPDSDGTKGIRGVILNSGGAVSGTEFYIVDWSGDQRYPDVAYSAAMDRYLVVWEDNYGSFPEPPDVYGASLDSSGSDRQFRYISGSTPGNQILPAVAANDANGRWLVMWSDSRDYATTGYDVYGQQVQFSGALVSLWGSQVHIGEFWGSASAPDVAWGQIGTGDGEFLTVWSENSLVYGQRVQANSTLVGDVITVSTDYDSSKSYPALAFDSADEAWWVVWADNRDYG
jgi:hypothetical protein